MQTPVLKTENLSISFGGLHAVEDFNIEIGSNELVGLIGPNGAGKTTVFNMLTGVYTPTHGTIELCGKNIVRKKPEQIVRMGISRTFQNIRLFKGMTVLDNVKVACNHEMKYSIASAMFRAGGFWKEEVEVDERARQILRVFNLEEFASTMADSLPYGQQRKLEIARALAAEPKLLLLDEPAAGMNPTETQDLMTMIQFVRRNFNISILLIEHDMSLVLGICERITVLDYGKIISTGTPNEIVNDPKVISAYLGS